MKQTYGQGVATADEPFYVGRQVKGVERIGQNGREMQLVQSKNLASREIATAMGVPGHLVGAESAYGQWGSSYSEQRRNLTQYSLNDHGNELASAFSMKTNAPLTLDSTEFLIGLPEERIEIWSKVWLADAITLDEYRARIGQEATGDAKGGMYYSELTGSGGNDGIIT